MNREQTLKRYSLKPKAALSENSGCLSCAIRMRNIVGACYEQKRDNLPKRVNYH